MVSVELINKSIDNAISKCSDGTSFNKSLRASFDRFREEYGGLTDHEELSILGNQGNLLLHSKGGAHGVEVDSEELENGDYRNLHIIHNHPTLFTDNVPTYLSEGDMENFIKEDVYRSITAVSPNGTQMILIKTNKFDSENRSSWNALMDLHDYCQSYYDFYEDRVIDYMTNKAIEYQKAHNGEFIKASSFRQEASESVIKDMGTLKQYLEKHGVYDSLNEYGFRLRF